MKEGLRIVFLPIQWAYRIMLLSGFLMVHISASPIRAFIYWGRSMKACPGWKELLGFNEDIEMGLSCRPQARTMKDLVS